LLYPGQSLPIALSRHGSLSIVLLASPVRLRRFSSTIPDGGCTRDAVLQGVGVASRMRRDQVAVQAFKFGSTRSSSCCLHPVGVNRLVGVSGRPADGDAQFGSFLDSGAHLHPERATTGEELRAEAASGEGEPNGGCTPQESYPHARLSGGVSRCYDVHAWV
jgi:hypothetical protein